MLSSLSWSFMTSASPIIGSAVPSTTAPIRSSTRRLSLPEYGTDYNPHSHVLSYSIPMSGPILSTFTHPDLTLLHAEHDPLQHPRRVAPPSSGIRGLLICPRTGRACPSCRSGNCAPSRHAGRVSKCNRASPPWHAPSFSLYSPMWTTDTNPCLYSVPGSMRTGFPLTV